MEFIFVMNDVTLLQGMESYFKKTIIKSLSNIQRLRNILQQSKILYNFDWK